MTVAMTNLMAFFDDVVIKALPGEMNKAMEMMNMIMMDVT